MKTWQVLTLCFSLLASAVIHRSFDRYNVTGHRFGDRSIIVKADKWTGETWKFHVTEGWTKIAANPFDKFDADAYLGLGATVPQTANAQPITPPGQLRATPADMDELAKEFEAKGAKTLAATARQRAQEMREQSSK